MIGNTTGEIHQRELSPNTTDDSERGPRFMPPPGPPSRIQKGGFPEPMKRPNPGPPPTPPPHTKPSTGKMPPDPSVPVKTGNRAGAGAILLIGIAVIAFVLLRLFGAI